MDNPTDFLKVLDDLEFLNPNRDKENLDKGWIMAWLYPDIGKYPYKYVGRISTSPKLSMVSSRSRCSHLLTILALPTQIASATWQGNAEKVCYQMAIRRGREHDDEQLNFGEHYYFQTNTPGPGLISTSVACRQTGLIYPFWHMKHLTNHSQTAATDTTDHPMAFPGLHQAILLSKGLMEGNWNRQHIDRALRRHVLDDPAIPMAPAETTWRNLSNVVKNQCHKPSPSHHQK